MSAVSSSALKVVYGKANELGQLVAHTPLTGTITAIKKHVATVGVHNVVTMALFLRLLVPRVGGAFPFPRGVARTLAPRCALL